MPRQVSQPREFERQVRQAIQDASYAFNRGNFNEAVEIMAKAAKLKETPAVGPTKLGPYGLRDNERIRYAKDLKGKKAVLFTRLVDDTVYFGIARCNREAGDKFDRDLGVNLARTRAVEVEKDRVVLGIDDEGPYYNLYTSEDGLSGECDVEDVLDLLDYFYTVADR
jgi:hypothetical protein